MSDTNHPASRAARQRRDAANRARRWRETQREAAALDAALVAGLMRAAGGRRGVDGQLRTREREVVIADVVGWAAYALGGRDRNAFEDAKTRLLDRLGAAVDSRG